MRPRKRPSSGGQSESAGGGKTRARVARTGNPRRREPPIKAVAEKKTERSDYRCPPQGACGAAGRARCRSPTRATARSDELGGRPDGVTPTPDCGYLQPQRKRQGYGKRQRAEAKTDGAVFEERQRRHDQSGSGGCAADGAVNPPERGRGAAPDPQGWRRGRPADREPVGRPRAKRAAGASAASPTNNVEDGRSPADNRCPRRASGH